jgi:hypothetical protein
MQNPLVKKDLIDAILELREEVERQLKANKYYVAMGKLDELLAAIRPLETIEISLSRTEMPSPEPEAETAATVEAPSKPVRTWSGVVQEAVVEPSWQSAPA